ncbi:MAG: hypothetical protein ACI4MQ_03395 [Candidatus Coproplasma sp.]
MKKLFKRASLILLTVCTVFACAFALSACGKSYTFYIQNADGTACSEVYGLQFCSNETGACYPIPEEIAPDANGKITLSQSKINEICHSDGMDVTAFAFHVFIETENDILDYEFAVDGAKEYTCKLTTPKTN